MAIARPEATSLASHVFSSRYRSTVRDGHNRVTAVQACHNFSYVNFDAFDVCVILVLAWFSLLDGGYRI